MYKKIYSLRFHLELQRKGFKPIEVMPNPQFPQYNCWIYEATSEFMEAFIQLKEARGGDRSGQ